MVALVTLRTVPWGKAAGQACCEHVRTPSLYCQLLGVKPKPQKWLGTEPQKEICHTKTQSVKNCLPSNLKACNSFFLCESSNNLRFVPKTFKVLERQPQTHFQQWQPLTFDLPLYVRESTTLQNST